MKKNEVICDALKTILILTIITMVAVALNYIGFRGDNLFMLYGVAILLIVTATKKFLWGALSAPICILLFNFFLTEPQFTFMVDDTNYFVSFGVFLVVAFIVSTLTTRLNNQVLLSKENEIRTSQLYKISSGYLNISGRQNIVPYAEQSLSDLINMRCALYVKDEGETFSDAAVQFCCESSLPCGVGEGCYEEKKLKYLPIKSAQKTIGVLSVQTDGTDIDAKKMVYINTALSQIALALERDFLSKIEEQNRLDIEKEKLKTSLLRSISHDLRTPLTSISAGAEFLIGNIQNVDTETLKLMLSDIASDAAWLGSMVQNLLNMTRLQEGKLTINAKKEVVDDIIAEAAKRTEKRLDGRSILLVPPKDITLVNMDGQLIVQVLVNLIENSIKHTKSGSDISVSAYRENNNMVFEVQDNGGGIKEEILGNIFDSFVTRESGAADSHRGVGLGLSIAKSIVGAHGGTIEASNNQVGGATFKFALPMREENEWTKEQF